eukprot:Nitzschia sp. Nitz4//scaffold203_size38902//11815//16567//NITZ4_007659-RA/size38902-augustus-gene-0.48-mRNA-1//-1//CDS//3329541421//6122//frame0
MGDDYKEADPDKEKKRKKALRRMVKMVGRAWELGHAEPFHSAASSSSAVILCLSSLGQKLDQEAYKYGRHGWEDFARDFGGVYNYHIHRKTKHAKVAKSHLQQIADMLAEKDASLAKVALDYVPPERKASTATKKRASVDSSADVHVERTKKKRRPSADPELMEREKRALENLVAFIQDNGGNPKLIQKYTCTVRRKPSDGRYDTNYYNEHGRRFRSMVEVAKFLKLKVVAPARSAAGSKTASIKRKATSREVENEKKRLRKELEKLMRQHTKARKTLDDYLTEDKEPNDPDVDDMLLQEQTDSGGSRMSKVLPTNCPAARLPDLDGFPGLPSYCIPEVLSTWDFLSTFSRSLNLNPIPLDDFVLCLTYVPPTDLPDSDAFSSPPVFLGEAHLALLKLVLADKSSDDWWWSILETPVTENAVADLGDVAGGEESDLPLIRVDFAALLLETEEAVITHTWLQNLDKVRKLPPTDRTGITDAINEALSIVHNRWVRAYLKKALKLGKTSGAEFMQRSILWLVDKVNDAKSDTGTRMTKAALAKRAKVVEEVSQQMEKLSSAVLAVTDEDLLSDMEDSDEESDDEEVDEKEVAVNDNTGTRLNPDERPASYIPQKPPPSLVDFLLPPGKPLPPTELLNPVCWPPMVGAAATRIIHRYKRLRNELDDSLRLIRELPKLTVLQRRERERIASSRVFSEFSDRQGDEDPVQKAADHLCGGGDYLKLSPAQRLSLLRVLIDAAYDTGRVYEIVDSNHKQRTNAVKLLDQEQRRAKREAKEKAAAGEAAAREDLALEARRNFIEEKREEIRTANAANHSLTEEEIDELTEEDILDFDDDIRADFEALPAPESFKKAEVLARVAQIDEAAAFETEHLTVLTMEELLKREEAELEEMNQEFEELGGEDALLNPSMDRHTAKRIEKLRRELSKIQNTSHSFPIQREAALDTLKEAIADGTIKSLRAAIRIAKTARLFGPNEVTNGVWALDVVRDAHMELENAKQLKRVADAQKDLVTKLNRCFTRTMPLGVDRFRNRFWKFENTDQCHVWAEVTPLIGENSADMANQYGFMPVVAKKEDVTVGATDIEDDFVPTDHASDFLRFSRQEYHASGETASLATRLWGCHVTESSIRTLMKGLDSKFRREDELKKNLKEALEKTTGDNPTEEPKIASSSEGEDVNPSEPDDLEKEKSEKQLQASGDEDAFQQAKFAAQNQPNDWINMATVQPLTTAIGQEVRVRIEVEVTKDAEIARYETGTITGWTYRKDTVAVEPDGSEFEPQTKEVDTPVWIASTGLGREHTLTGSVLLESICRHQKYSSKDPTYFESDASFLSYQNALGRHCGKAPLQALTPSRFAQYMIRREGELYQRLKHRVFDNSWGGKNGNRNAWMASMKDFAFDFETVREGLLTFESAFVELTGGMPEGGADGPSGRELLENPSTREDIELESIERTVQCLWNSRASRAVFLEIMKSCKSVGFLALGLELVCRNAKAYIDVNIGAGSAATSSYPQEATSSYLDAGTSSRSSRRGANAWQRAEDSTSYDDEPTSRPSRRVARVNYMGLD